MDINNIAVFLLKSGEVVHNPYPEYPQKSIQFGKKSFTAVYSRCNSQNTIRWIIYEES